MLANLRRSIVSVVIFTAFFGFAYALAGTGVAQVLFPHQADDLVTPAGLTHHLVTLFLEGLSQVETDESLVFCYHEPCAHSALPLPFRPRGRLIVLVPHHPQR